MDIEQSSLTHTKHGHTHTKITDTTTQIITAKHTYTLYKTQNCTPQVKQQWLLAHLELGVAGEESQLPRQRVRFLGHGGPQSVTPRRVNAAIFLQTLALRWTINSKQYRVNSQKQTVYGKP